MKKDGLLGQLIKATVEEEKKRYAGKEPDIFTNQKKQMWYFRMNQIDGAQDADAENKRK